MTLKNPADDIATDLGGETVGGVDLVKGTNIFATQIHPRPWSLCVECLNSGGLSPEPYLSATASAFMRPSVQLLVWGTPGEDGFVTGEALARALVGRLQQTVPTGYVSLFCREAQPLYVGVDPETQRHSWSINVEAQYVA